MIGSCPCAGSGRRGPARGSSGRITHGTHGLSTKTGGLPQLFHIATASTQLFHMYDFLVFFARQLLARDRPLGGGHDNMNPTEMTEVFEARLRTGVPFVH